MHMYACRACRYILYCIVYVLYMQDNLIITTSVYICTYNTQITNLDVICITVKIMCVVFM